MNPKDRIVVALDYPLYEEAVSAIKILVPYVGMFKVGLRAITAGYAQKLAEVVKEYHKPCIWDGKFCDIPETVAWATWQLNEFKIVDFFTVHASAGFESLLAASSHQHYARMLGVTVLSSLGEGECAVIFGSTPEKKTLEFARMLKNCGATGIICAPRELGVINSDLDLIHLFKFAVGIRPQWAPPHDQRRFLTPAQALHAGADYLIIGRPVTHPPEEIGGSVEAVKRIVAEIAQVNKTP